MEQDTKNNERRHFLKQASLLTAGMFVVPQITLFSSNEWFKISLAQWSLHRMLRDGKLNHLDFPEFTKKEFGINAVEYVSTFFSEANLSSELKELKLRCDDNNIKSLLIMVDLQGDFGVSDKNEIEKTLQNHYKWVEAAKYLGCHSIRVNARGTGSKKEVAKAATNSLYRLGEFSKDFGINVLVENHGGYSSNGNWLSGVIKKVNLPNVGTLPDFGNFKINKIKDKNYNKYKGVKQLMPYAKAVSAKCYDFDAFGETTIDYKKMLNIVKSHNYTGYIGIEYVGKRLTEVEGIKACKKLLTTLNYT